MDIGKLYETLTGEPYPHMRAALEALRPRGDLAKTAPVPPSRRRQAPGSKEQRPA